MTIESQYPTQIDRRGLFGPYTLEEHMGGFMKYWLWHDAFKEAYLGRPRVVRSDYAASSAGMGICETTWCP
jgi:hypothetical protein